MFKILIHVLATAAALLLIPEFIQGIEVGGFYTALVVAVLWGIVGLTIRPILSILTLPITIITFGLFSFIINALLFWFLATFIDGFTVDGFIPALLGSLVLSAVAWVLHSLL